MVLSRLELLSLFCYIEFMKNLHNKTSWGEVAQWYDDLVEDRGSYQSDLILPNILRLMNPQSGDKILDVACGQGFFTREILHAFPNIEGITGVDISPELINIAKRKARDIQKITFQVSPADKMSGIKDGGMNKALINLAIQNIENASLVWKEISRALASDGELHIVINHPAFRVLKNSEWGWDEENMKQYRRINSYMTEAKIPVDMSPGEVIEDKKSFTYSFHRPLQWYFKTLGNAGFAVSRLEEWTSNKESQKGPRSEEENRIRKEIPLFMYIKAVKLYP